MCMESSRPMAKRRNENGSRPDEPSKNGADASKSADTCQDGTSVTEGTKDADEPGSADADGTRHAVEGSPDGNGAANAADSHGDDASGNDASGEDEEDSKTGSDGKHEDVPKGTRKPRFVLIGGGKGTGRQTAGKGAGTSDKGRKKRRLKHPRLLAALVAALAVCGGTGGYLYYRHVTQPSEQQVAPGDWEHMVAGTVDGHEIMESEVNAYVARYRKMANLTGDSEWATYLDKQGLTIKSFREKAVKALQEQYVAEQEAKDADLSVTDSDIDAAISDARKQAGYEGDDDGWKSFLDRLGYTEDSYRADIRATYVENALAQRNAVMSTPTETQMQSQASEDVSKWTGKKVYAATVRSDGSTADLARARSKAQAIADAVTKGGSHVTSDALAQASAPEGGTVSEVGWSGLATMQDAYKTAIADLHAGQVSGPVRSDEGYAVILVTDEFDADASDTVRVSDMPRDLYDKLYDETSRSLNANAVATYLDGLLAKHESSVSDMPEGLPYHVDIDAKSQFETGANESDGSGDANATGNEDAATGSDGTQAGE